MQTMRLAVLADTHGNLPALEAVLADIERHNVDHTVVAGDLVGGPKPVETIRLLRSQVEWAVLGTNTISKQEKEAAIVITAIRRIATNQKVIPAVVININEDRGGKVQPRTLWEDCEFLAALLNVHLHLPVSKRTRANETIVKICDLFLNMIPPPNDFGNASSAFPAEPVV